jgi:hypothetical protein
MRKVLPAVLAAMALYACGDDDDDEPQNLQEWSTNLVGQGISPDVSGQSTVRQELDEDGFTARISIEDDQSGTRRPWHVHFGTCATGGDIVGDPASYPVLNIAGNGRANATATVEGVRLITGEPYHVNVHLSPDELDTIIACGDLSIVRAPDAGLEGDAAAREDAGRDAGVARDAGVVRDAGVRLDAGVGQDASFPFDAAAVLDASR